VRWVRVFLGHADEEGSALHWLPTRMLSLYSGQIAVLVQILRDADRVASTGSMLC
jgi:hypothetical protein